MSHANIIKFMLPFLYPLNKNEHKGTNICGKK